MSVRRFRVVGAGVSGLAAALLLARRGAWVEVLDRGPRAGGLAGAERFRGIPCDVGSHRLHREALSIPLFDEMSREVHFLERPRRGVLLLGGRRIAYPPSVAGLLGGVGAAGATGMAVGWLRARSWRGATAGTEDLGFEDFVRGRVGAAAYERFYRPYAEKVWGLPARELSQTVAKKRVSTVDPWSLLRGGRVAGSYFYPREGFAAMARWLEERLLERGARVRYGVAWDAAAHEGDVERVLFAGALRDLVPSGLEHRGLYLVYLALPVVSVGAAETWYVPEARYWFGRVGDVGNYAPGRVPHGETVLCVEVPEGRWGRGVDFVSGARGRELLEQLREAGIVPAGVEPVEARQVFVPDVYPLYRRGWRASWGAAMELVAARERALPFGRQGLFLHCNTDHCVSIAADAVEHVWGGGGVRSWLAQAERYLALQVRD